jgi:hypothetical protein
LHSAPHGTGGADSPNQYHKRQKKTPMIMLMATVGHRREKLTVREEPQTGRLIFGGLFLLTDDPLFYIQKATVI